MIAGAAVAAAVVLVAAAVAVWRYVSAPAVLRGTGGATFGDNAPPVGRPAPEFVLPRLTGGTLALRSLRGRPVVLNFWASWCAPCREETPMLVRLYKRYGPRGVQFVGVDAEDRPGDARRFAAQYQVPYPLVRTDDERLVDAYAVPGLPTTVFIDAGGTVVGKVVGGFAGAEGERLLVVRLERLIQGAGR